jgi:SAM-dependent methyltransferase
VTIVAPVEPVPALMPPDDPRLALTSCPLCGEDDAEPVAVGADFAHDTTPASFLAVRCRSCDLVYLNPRPAAGDLARLYPTAYFGPPPSGARRPRQSRAVVRHLTRLAKVLPRDARLVTAGYGPRLYLEDILHAGRPAWTLEVVTPHATLAASARQAGIAVSDGTARALKSQGALYDAILLFDALEHCQEPLAELLALGELLRPGGHIAILTPNADSAVSHRFRGRHWDGYDFPRHATLFGPRSLRQLAARAGLDIERLATVPDPGMWSRSAANLLRDWGPTRWLTRSPRWGALLAGAPARLAEGVARRDHRAGVLEAVLRKPEGGLP